MIDTGFKIDGLWYNESEAPDAQVTPAVVAGVTQEPCMLPQTLLSTNVSLRFGTISVLCGMFTAGPERVDVAKSMRRYLPTQPASYRDKLRLTASVCDDLHSFATRRKLCTYQQFQCFNRDWQKRLRNRS